MEVAGLEEIMCRIRQCTPHSRHRTLCIRAWPKVRYLSQKLETMMLFLQWIILYVRVTIDCHIVGLQFKTLLFARTLYQQAFELQRRPDRDFCDFGCKILSKEFLLSYDLKIR